MNNASGKNEVTVGIPAHNGKEFIKQAIESVLSQTFTDFELIISDDASSDGTENICKEYAKIDHRIKYFRQKNNIGGFANNKFILDHAQGKYITMLAHDDALNPEFIEKTLDYIKRNDDCILVS